METVGHSNNGKIRRAYGRTWLVGTCLILEITVDEMIRQVLGKQRRVAWELTGDIADILN